MSKTTLLSSLNENSREQDLLNNTQRNNATLWPCVHTMSAIFYFSVFLVSPIISNAYSAAYKLNGFNKSLDSLNIRAISIGFIIALVVINEIVFFFYTTQPAKQKHDIEKSLRSQYQTPRPPLKIEKTASTSKILIYLILFINLGFFIWNTGKNSYSMFKDVKLFGHKMGYASLFIAGFCALGALMATVTYPMQVAPKIFPHILKLKSLYKTPKQKLEGILLVILAITSIPLFMAFGLDAMPWWLALISSFTTALLIYVTSINSVSSKELDDLNKTDTTNMSVYEKKIQDKLSKELKELKDKKINEYKERDIRFVIAFVLFGINCLIAGAGTGFGVQFVLSDQSALSKHFKFNFSPTAVWISSAIAVVLALVGRAHFCRYEPTIGSMMLKMTDIKNNIKNSTRRDKAKALFFSVGVTAISIYILNKYYGNIWSGLFVGVGISIALILYKLCQDTTKDLENNIENGSITDNDLQL